MQETTSTEVKLDVINTEHIETTAWVTCPECTATNTRRVFVNKRTWETCQHCKALFVLEVWVDVRTRSRRIEQVPEQNTKPEPDQPSPPAPEKPAKRPAPPRPKPNNSF